MLIRLSFCMWFTASALWSTEIDSFTDRDETIQNSIYPLNQFMQNYFDYALRKANKENSCDSTVIEEALEKKNGNIFFADIEDDIENSILVDKRRSPFNKSIYRDLNLFISPILQFAKLGFIVRVDNLLVGSDKFGHFMQQGYSYFKKIYHEKKTILDALAWGEMTEETYFGLTSTGVYSYADLAANYDGLRFWERVTGVNTGGKDLSYFSCTNGHWTQITSFDWREYVSLAWDEAMNCSRYRTQGADEDIQIRIKQLEKERGVRLTCPINPSQCSQLRVGYEDVSRHVLSPKCGF